MIPILCNIVRLSRAVFILTLLSGCAGFQDLNGLATATEGGTSSGYAPHTTDLSDKEAQQFLQEQDEKVRTLLEMRADLEEKIHTIQETDIGRLNTETETLRDRVASVESKALRAREEIDAQRAPLQALAEIQANELANLKESMLAIVEETHQDRQLLRNNLKNYRDALVEFHALMVKLETLVLDEEFRAKEAETGLRKSMKDHGLMLTRLDSKSTALVHLQKRMTQLHRYINEVQKDLRHAVATWEAGAQSKNGSRNTALQEQQETFVLSPLSLDDPTESTNRPKRPALVPLVDEMIQPLEEPARLNSNEQTPVTSALDAEGDTTVKRPGAGDE